MKEKDFQSQFKNKNSEVGVFELKLSKQKSIRVDAVKEHQVEALLKANSRDGLYHKISDTPFIKNNPQRFTKKKPFDCFYLEEVPAYVVIMFYEPSAKKNVYYVPIKNWIKLASEVTMKSVRENVISNYATIKQSYV